MQAVNMTSDELQMFKMFLGPVNKYLEFGAGGSTVLAKSMNKASIISVDSSYRWIAKVKAECEAIPGPQPLMVKADIGDTTEWGYPKDDSKKANWPSYYSSVWNVPGSKDADLYFIDGRFRVACSMMVAIQARPQAIMLLHDFFSRPSYHMVTDVFREIARAGDLSAFQVANAPKANAILGDFAYDTR